MPNTDASNDENPDFYELSSGVVAQRDEQHMVLYMQPVNHDDDKLERAQIVLQPGLRLPLGGLPYGSSLAAVRRIAVPGAAMAELDGMRF